MVKLALENIVFSYGSLPVLKGITADFAKGSFTGIIGPNGSGKSTLIRCILGFLESKDGRILFDGKDHREFSSGERACKIAYMAQSEQAVFANTVYDTVLLGRKPYISFKHGNKDLEIVEQIIEKLELKDIAFRELSRISGGQRQRALIGRALAQQPEILLLDEPTANLDMRHQFEIMNILKELSNENMTILIAIHDLNLALKYCSHFLMLYEGEIFAKGEKDIFTRENIEYLYKIKVSIQHEEDDVFVLPKEQL